MNSTKSEILCLMYLYLYLVNRGLRFQSRCGEVLQLSYVANGVASKRVRSFLLTQHPSRRC